jgi:hypothetical protein
MLIAHDRHAYRTARPATIQRSLDDDGEHTRLTPSMGLTIPPALLDLSGLQMGGTKSPHWEPLSH